MIPTLTANLPAGLYPKYDLAGLPSFRPAFTPNQLVSLGIFGGNYFGGPEVDFSRDTEGVDPQIVLGHRHKIRQTNRKYDWKHGNYYGVKSGKDYKWWSDNGFIFPEDPVGWFQWFCRFDQGRRHPRDAHQIIRHQNFVRWANNIRNQHIIGKDLSPVICQSLLHWSWHPRDAAQGKKVY